jgi:MoxR-like ATPase
MVFDPKTSEFVPHQGPVFANLVLADEINRAPAKVQSALLEAMEERQVTIGDATFQLPGAFVVLATQNPIEQEGTYPLPEAQLDRFLFKIVVDYPSQDDELRVLEYHLGDRFPEPSSRCAGVGN